MNQHTLEIQTRSKPDILERILRVTRHRGFLVTTMQMHETDDHQQLKLQVTVCSERSISLLYNQIAKLVDVAQVNLLCGEQQQKWA